MGWQSTGYMDWQTAAVYGGMVPPMALAYSLYLQFLQKLRPFVNYRYSRFLLILSLLEIVSGLVVLLLHIQSG
ncbi:hypothetical protein PD5205_03335 [Xanthomonas fragariae]|uniref:Uncharacterized protein n=1 Tax=Xanthomonas fragariae TaxID=48664 RepID=A0A1Y6H342_9XANT|nr:hypothetical protein BER92_16245 [Xanthomonas fragariae]SMQ96834.1 hypothetical protein NBC2815_03516 [Xanthomonas fragariae]SMQ97924.1 hypothetical protein PD885_00656 [Xanthomonas fragariae]SMR04611.1 hypothetical protein PD5205_03335 [Xanthomonas fragariae]